MPSLSPVLPTRARVGASAVGIVIALALLGVVFFYAWRTAGGTEDGPKPLTLEERYRADDRLVPLLARCAQGRAFDVDTSNLAELLVAKLDAGSQLDPLRRAKMELASMGDEVAEPLGRLFQDASKDQYRTAVAKNILTVCALAEGDWGVPIALEGLNAAAQDLRSDAALVIKAHPSPEHYDALAAVLPGFTLPVNLSRCLQAMHACDPLRFAREVPDWIEEARPDTGFIVSAFVDEALPLVASVDDPEIAQTYRELARDGRGLLHRHKAYLLAPAVRQGDEDALRDLKDFLAHETELPRRHAARALVAAGRAIDTYVLAASSEHPAERSSTLAMLLENTPKDDLSTEQREEVVLWARRALSDESVEVQEVALEGLLARGDEEGFSTLMNLLNGTISKRGVAMRAMRENLDDRPDWADHIRSVLIALWEQEIHSSAPRVNELTSILAAMGAVPGEATGRFLLEAADTIGDNPIDRIRGFRWVIGQAFNAGESSQAVLRERFATETDPINRLDLISFLWQDFSEASVDVLLGVVDDDSLSPYERLYAAGKVVHMGHNERALPVLKRVYRSSTDEVLRPGLHCLLWIWFGPPIG